MIKLKQWHFSINLEDNLQTKQMPCSTFPPLPRILLFQNNQQYWSKNWLLLKLLTMHNNSSCHESSMFQLKQRHFWSIVMIFAIYVNAQLLFPSPSMNCSSTLLFQSKPQYQSIDQILLWSSNVATNHQCFNWNKDTFQSIMRIFAIYANSQLLFPSPSPPIPKQTAILINWLTTSSMWIKKILSNIAVNHQCFNSNKNRNNQMWGFL